jgi:hypothetical protein
LVEAARLAELGAFAPPAYTGLALEPGSLPTGVDSGRLPDLAQGFVEWDVVAKVGLDLAIPDTSKRADVVAPSCPERANLFDPARAEHLPRALFDDRRVPLSVHVENDEYRVVSGLTERVFGAKGTQGCAGLFIDFERPDDSNDVVGMNCLGGDRIDLREPRMQRKSAFPGRRCFEALPDFTMIGRRPRPRIAAIAASASSA